jgi:hypothetical protein
MKDIKKIEREADRYVDPNETKFQRAMRYLNYYKVPLIAIICIIAVFVVMTFTLVGKEEIDMYVFFVCDDEYAFLSDESDYLDFFSDMTEFITSYTEDYNGDGEIKVSIDTVHISSNELLYQDTVEMNKKRITAALSAGTCMCIIGDSAGFEYLSSSDILQDISYLVDETSFNGKAYKLNDSEIAVNALKIDGEEPLYMGLRAYYGTFAEMKEKETAYFTIAERMIKTISDPTFDPETDTVPAPVN